MARKKIILANKKDGDLINLGEIQGFMDDPFFGRAVAKKQTPTEKGGRSLSLAASPAPTARGTVAATIGTEPAKPFAPS